MSRHDNNLKLLIQQLLNYNSLSLNKALLVTALVALDNVHFSYENRAILSGITLTVPKGKVVAIMGASGGGKTTLLRLMGGQITASSGTVKVDGQDMAQLSTRELYEQRRKMGMLFQFGALFTDLSVFENVAFPMREHTDLPE